MDRLAMSPDPSPEPKRQRNGGRGSFLALAGVGTEISATIGVMIWIGWWLDRKLGFNGPWCLLTGALIGIVGSFYKVWRQSKRFFG